MTIPKSLVARLDEFVYLKNGYLFLKHLLPFSVAALLLLILSVPDNNLLLQLVKALERPSWLWMPSALLTFVATLVYVVAVYIQVRQAYLDPSNNLRRTFTTSIIYMFLCTLMAYSVLWSASPQPTSSGALWACFLLAVLSLTGIGWSGPNSWVESLGVKSPNYTAAHQSLEKLTYTLRQARDKPFGEKRDIEDFLEAAKNLRSEIEKNLVLEPEWAKYYLHKVGDNLRSLIEQTKDHFPFDDKAAVEDFAPASRCQKRSLYLEYIEAVERMSDYWREFQCPNGK